MRNSSKNGVLYIATGSKYVRAAIKSAKSVNLFCPELPIHLFSDKKSIIEFNFDNNPSPFFSIESISSPHRRSKVDFLGKTPFDYTLYLDSDTRLKSDVNHLFDLLNQFDIAMAHAHLRNAPHHLKTWKIDLTMAFPQFNSGVILFKNNEKVLKFLENWSNQFEQASFNEDQVTLRELLWESDLRIATLPPEYNVRFIKYSYIWKKSEATPKIFHLRKYHDGPLWRLSKITKNLLRSILVLFGINPREIRKRLYKE